MLEDINSIIVCYRLYGGQDQVGRARNNAHCGALTTSAPPAIVVARCRGFTSLRADSPQLEVWLEKINPATGFLDEVELDSVPRVFDYSRFPQGSTSRENGDGTLTIYRPPYEVNVRRGALFDELKTLAARTVLGNDTSNDLLNHFLFHLTTPLCVPATQDKKMRPARIIVLGDCHAMIAATQSSTGTDSCALSNYQVCSVAGASAYGLVNRNSSTAAAAKFSNCVRRWSGPDASCIDYIAIHIGEVDFRNVYSFRSKIKDVTMLEQIKDSVARLMIFVKEVLISAHGFRMNQIVLLGTTFTCPFVAGRAEPGVAGFTRYINVRNDSAAIIRYHSELKRRCQVRGDLDYKHKRCIQNLLLPVQICFLLKGCWVFICKPTRRCA